MVDFFLSYDGPENTVLQLLETNQGSVRVICKPGGSGGAVVTNLVDGLAPRITAAESALVSNAAGVAALWSPVATLGSYIPVADLAGRNAIPSGRRVEGTTAYQVDTQQMWRLVGGIANANWVDVTVSVVSTTAPGVVPLLPAGNTLLTSNGAAAAWTSFLQLGAAPAAAGTIRLSADSTIAFKAVAGGTPDVSVFKTSNDAANTLTFGDFTKNYSVVLASPLSIVLAAGNSLGGQPTVTIASARINVFTALVEFQLGDVNGQNIIRNVNFGAGSAIPGSELVMRAGGNIAAAQAGGRARVQGGRAGAGGDFGGVTLQLNNDDTIANMVTMVEAKHLAAARRVVSLVRGADITTTQMPANTGDLVTYIGNAATAPTASAVSGGILYAEGGALKWRGSGGTVTTMGPA